MFYAESIRMDRAENQKRVEDLLRRCDLTMPADVDFTAGVFEERAFEAGGVLVATGSLKGDMIQGVAVDPAHQGEDLLARLLTCLIDEAGKRGLSSLYLFTKPERAIQFQGLGFRQVAAVRPYAALMEWGEAGIDAYVAGLSHVRQEAENVWRGGLVCGRYEKKRAPEAHGTDELCGACGADDAHGISGVQSEVPIAAAIVMNANPFTWGHRYLIEVAASEADILYVLVVEEDASMFSYRDRLAMVKQGMADIPNVIVLGGGRYAVSALTFPSYFTGEEKVAYAHTAMDAELFCRYIAPSLGISLRFVGSEPFSPITRLYNETLAARLPRSGIILRQLKRMEADGPISASKVRSLIRNNGGKVAGIESILKKLVPETTIAYLRKLETT